MHAHPLLLLYVFGQHSGEKSVFAKKVNIHCPIGLKPFEEEFSKRLEKSKQKSNTKRKKEFVKQLLSKFAPNSIKPEKDFYNYINYQWLKNVNLEQQQKYIVQVDSFRLIQDKVYTQLDEIVLKYIRTNHNKLAKNLEYFPIALSQAGAYISQNFLTIQEYLSLYRNNKILLHNESKVNGKSVEKKVQILPLKKKRKNFTYKI